MNIMLLAALVAIAQQTPLLTAPTPKNFGTYRQILPTMPAEIADQPVDVRIGIELLIDPLGKPTNCRVVDPGGSRAMANWVCDNMRRRSRFNPAKDGSGNAIFSYFTYWKTFGFLNVVPFTKTPPDALASVNHAIGSDIDSNTQLTLLINGYGSIE